MTMNVAILNNTDETISITDIVGTIRYNKDLYEKNISSSINTPNIPKSYLERPVGFGNIVNLNIAPHESENKTFQIIFPNVILNFVDRMGLAHFVGFIDRFRRKAILYAASEMELKQNWTSSPIQLLLSFHINGEKLIHVIEGVFPGGINMIQGTINYGDLERIKIDYYENRRLNSND